MMNRLLLLLAVPALARKCEINNPLLPASEQAQGDPIDGLVNLGGPVYLVPYGNCTDFPPWVADEVERILSKSPVGYAKRNIEGFREAKAPNSGLGGILLFDSDPELAWDYATGYGPAAEVIEDSLAQAQERFPWLPSSDIAYAVESCLVDPERSANSRTNYSKEVGAEIVAYRVSSNVVRNAPQHEGRRWMSVALSVHRTLYEPTRSTVKELVGERTIWNHMTGNRTVIPTYRFREIIPSLSLDQRRELEATEEVRAKQVLQKLYRK